MSQSNHRKEDLVSKFVKRSTRPVGWFSNESFLWDKTSLLLRKRYTNSHENITHKHK